MDEPSAQLQLDLSRAVQHALATRRPLLHRLHGSSWVLQLPRPANAVRHGSRFYYNILVDPCFQRQDVASDGWFSRPRLPQGHLYTIAMLEELLRDLETLADNLRSESDRKSNTATAGDELGKLDTLVDAVAVTCSDNSCEETLRDIHPDVPVFTSHEAIERIAGLQHFRSLEPMAKFGNGGCRDWRSTTAVAGMPEWVGMSLLIQQGYDPESRPTLLIAFNNHHYNRFAKAAKPKSSNGSRQKRHAATVPDEEEDSAEAVLFTPRRLAEDDATTISCADPPIHPLVVVRSSQTLEGNSSQLRAGEGASSERGWQGDVQATHCISERNVVIEKGVGFLAWLIAKASFANNKQSEEELRTSGAGHIEAAEDLHGLAWTMLGHGESKVLM